MADEKKSGGGGNFIKNMPKNVFNAVKDHPWRTVGVSLALIAVHMSTSGASLPLEAVNSGNVLTTSGELAKWTGGSLFGGGKEVIGGIGHMATNVNTETLTQGLSTVKTGLGF